MKIHKVKKKILFRNEREGRMHRVLVPNLYVRIFPDGHVLFSIR